jgi:hypothetical protein
MRAAVLLAGATLALTSALALAQGAPESLLPPGFNQPSPAPAPRASSTAPASNASPRAAGTPTPVIQALPSRPGLDLSPTMPAPDDGQGMLKRLPSLDELSRMSPEDFQDLLGLRPDFDMPNGARRAMTQVGLIDPGEGGLNGDALAGQNARLVRLALAANQGTMVSRWGHILLRRALASRLDPPAGMSPQEFLALRVGLLVRMGEADAARAILQDIDAGDYTPDLDGVALDVYADNGDFTGACPILATQGAARSDPQWSVAKSICSAFRGDGAAAIAQLDRYRFRGTMPRIDLLLAQKYAGAAGRSRRATTIEWNDVDDMTPWRFGLANAVGLNPPDRLIENADPRYASITALAPMVGLTRRAAAADRACAAGVLSSAAVVDLYGQLYAEPDVTGEWSERAEKLRDAYVLEDPAGRLAAMRSLWDGGKTAPQDYSRKVLTAYAAARLPASAQMADDAGPLIASMLSAGLDANAMRWANVVNAGSDGWAMLVLAAPSRSTQVENGDIDKFVDADDTEGSRKSALLVAGLAGLGRIDSGTAGTYSANLRMGLGGETRWTQAIDGAARHGDAVTVAFLAGLGMQGANWSQMTPRYLYHIVAALRTVGFDAEARMIAAEAVARS